MKGNDYLAVVGIALGVALVVNVVLAATGIPYITIRAPRNEQVTGQGTAPGATS